MSEFPNDAVEEDIAGDVDEAVMRETAKAALAEYRSHHRPLECPGCGGEVVAGAAENERSCVDCGWRPQ